MVAFLITVMLCSVTVAAATNEVTLPQLTLGTNTYKDVIIRKRSATEAVVRFSGGITKVAITNLTGLPEPIATEWNREAVAESAKESLKAEEAARAAAAAKVANEDKPQLPPRDDAVDFKRIDSPDPAASRPDSTSEALATGFAMLTFLGIIYFVPTIVAYSNKHRNAAGVLVLNFFLGWTLLGWVVALIWAIWRDKPSAAQR